VLAVPPCLTTVEFETIGVQTFGVVKKNPATVRVEWWIVLLYEDLGHGRCVRNRKRKFAIKRKKKRK